MNASPRAAGRHHAVLRDGGRDVVVCHVESQRRHVAVGPVRVFGPHGELLRGTLAVEHAAVREDLHRDDFGDLARILGRPAFSQLISVWCISHPSANRLPPVCGTLPNAFWIEQALFGNGEIDSPAADFTGQPLIVAVRIVAKE